MKTSPQTSPDAVPAHALWVQLNTRITTQPLHYRSGEEETAAESVSGIFKTVRDLMNAHPQARAFHEVSETMLNGVIRPYTARWHGWMTEDRKSLTAQGAPRVRFRDERVRRMFRRELRELQSKLDLYCRMYSRLAGADEHGQAQAGAGSTEAILGKDLAAVLRKDGVGEGRRADLGGDLDAGIGDQVEFANNCRAESINRFEHWSISRRRQMWNGEIVSEGSAPPEPQPPVKNATGLALSGGGIRSATFSLGIVQVLVRKGLFPRFDFLSTVSGGGYFGSFLSCALGTRQPGETGQTTRESGETKLNDVFHRQKGIESGLMRHLRNHSKYLLHGGFLGKMRMIGLLLSGVLWNLMIMLPIPLFAALLAKWTGSWLWGDAILANGPIFPIVLESRAGVSLVWLAVAFGVAWVTLPGIQLIAHGQAPKSKRAILRSVGENGTLWLGLGTAALGVLFMVPALFHWHEWIRLQLVTASDGGYTAKRIADLMPASLTGVAGAVLAAVAGWLAPKWPRLRAAVVKLFILSGPILLLFVFLLVANRMGLARDAEVWNWRCVLCVALVLAAWDWFFVNINTLAPHRYYRNRLCECFLARRIPEEEGRKQPLIRALSREPAQGKTEVLKQVPLSQLQVDLTAPYHLINMTVNARTSQNKNLRGRDADFFLASRHFYGSPLTGYAPTDELEKADPHFDLGTAMAVSGAAASTSMGWQTLPHFRFLMTLFNVRLGYWLRNPGRKAWPYLLEGAGPWYLFREMLGWIHERCRYVNLSDGGHIENLAVYELLRRRCKFIICVDGGCEPGMECSDLMRVQRYAEIDLGIRMHFDISDLQIDSNGLSRAHSILVKIDYAPETKPGTELGWMLYIKLAMTGVEPAYVKDYRRENPAFPHETTGDQIYDEAQFEAYRALGECAMDGMFREEIIGPDAPKSMQEWFQCLANSLLPDNDPVFHRPGS